MGFSISDRVERWNPKLGLFDGVGEVRRIRHGMVFVVWDDFPDLLLSYEAESPWIRRVEEVEIEIDASCDFCFARVRSGRCQTDGCRGSR